MGNYGAIFRQSTPPFIKLSAPLLESQLAALNAELGAANQERAMFDALTPASVIEIEKKAAATRSAAESKELADFAASQPPAQKQLIHALPASQNKSRPRRARLQQRW